MKKQELRIGGMATLNGVVMQTKNNWVYAARNAEGKLAVSSGKTFSIARYFPWIKNVPILRGLIFFVEALANAIVRTGGNKRSTKLIFLLVLTGIIFSAVMAGDVYNNASRIYALAQVAPLPIFFLLIRLSRLSSYHGAEHKSISAFENFGDSDVENIQNSSRIHIRCGTNLAIPLMLIFGASAWYGWGLIFQVLLISIAIEAFRFSTNNPSHLLAKLYLFGGALLQKITTKEPSLDQIEVAKTALNTLLDLEKEST